MWRNPGWSACSREFKSPALQEGRSKKCGKTGSLECTVQIGRLLGVRTARTDWWTDISRDFFWKSQWIRNFYQNSTVLILENIFSSSANLARDPWFPEFRIHAAFWICFPFWKTLYWIAFFPRCYFYFSFQGSDCSSSKDAKWLPTMIRVSFIR